MKNVGSRYKEKVRTLRRRKDFLEKLLNDYKGASPQHARAELGALTVAIELMEQNPELVKNILRFQKPGEEPAVLVKARINP